MIRIKKDTNIPPSLQAKKSGKYDEDDVKEALYKDQHGKCYLCEQTTGKSFEIEHLKAKASSFFPELKYAWSNLFLACPYCNGRKPIYLIYLFDPALYNIEDIIEQRISFSQNKVELISNQDTISAKHTIILLDKLLNGKSGVRDYKANILYKDIEREIVFFLGLLNNYKENNNSINKQAIVDSLHIKKEFLGFKYWIIKDNAEMYKEFKTFMVWNKIG